MLSCEDGDNANDEKNGNVWQGYRIFKKERLTTDIDINLIFALCYFLGVLDDQFSAPFIGIEHGEEFQHFIFTMVMSKRLSPGCHLD